jgi:hypothetical protein
MRPQFFANAGGGRFVELLADALGPWFAREQLGRGLARLDWDRDGRDDFAVSHLDSPAALLVNQSEPSGGCVALRLVGVHAARDAIATTVTARAADRTLTAQLTAGDGYQASNERRLTFGLGTADRLEDVVVRWPGGGEQRVGPLAAGAEYVLVEGQTPRFVRALAK